MIYIKILKPEKVYKKENIIKRVIMFILEILLPRANPDFDRKLDSVTTWLLEFWDENSIPDRELGLNVDDQVIVKMPYKNNAGYWTDNNLTLVDFKEIFKFEYITQKYFDVLWNSIFLNIE